MTYSDPANPLPDPGPGHNPPQNPQSSTLSLSTIVALAVAGVMVISAVVYSMRDSTTSILPPTTTGQGATPVNPPFAPPITALPTDQGVPPGVMAPQAEPTSPNLDSK